jgi:hypothetical protein
MDASHRSLIDKAILADARSHEMLGPFRVAHKDGGRHSYDLSTWVVRHHTNAHS